MASQRLPDGPRLPSYSNGPCVAFARGLCRSDRCHNYHHKNLDPALQAAREFDYMVPNKKGDACQRCMSLGLKCDKKGRALDGSDPCSQCRWFGGNDCDCKLAHTTSYNDVLWRVMLGRGIANYTLPAAKIHESASRGGLTQALGARHLRRDWQGLTHEQARRDAPLIPSFVRQLPRAYLVPPRPTVGQMSALAAQPVILKRKREASPNEESSTVKSTFLPALLEDRKPKTEVDAVGSGGKSTVLAAPEPQRPESYPGLGELTSSSYCWAKKRWTHVYSSGAVLHL